MGSLILADETFSLGRVADCCAKDCKGEEDALQLLVSALPGKLLLHHCCVAGSWTEPSESR